MTVDVTGLSPESVLAVEEFVRTLRAKETGPSWSQRDYEGWSKALREWVESHPKRDIVIDDSRETIYAGRGE